VLPLLGLIETPRPVPHSISEAVLKKAKAGAAVAMLALAIGLAGLVGSTSRAAAEEEETPQLQKWSFAGPFGAFDRGQLQRGFKVYHDVCQNCHSLKLLSFRNLAEPGGPAFSEAQVESIAAEYKVKDANDQGEIVERPARPADHFPPPFENDAQARQVTGGALPPDMSVLAKARGYERGFPGFVVDFFTQYQEAGPDYIVSIITGYQNPPAGVTMASGMQYNKMFPGHAIGMRKPLTDKQVDYTDGTPQTVEQYAKDVSAFLMWAAEPHLEARKRIGFQVMIFLVVFAGLLYFTKKKVWAAVH
jgi:ubiquinol-cytochrome c reductase cytochrome b/c1 subunit